MSWDDGGCEAVIVSSARTPIGWELYTRVEFSGCLVLVPLPVGVGVGPVVPDEATEQTAADVITRLIDGRSVRRATSQMLRMALTTST